MGAGGSGEVESSMASCPYAPLPSCNPPIVIVYQQQQERQRVSSSRIIALLLLLPLLMIAGGVLLLWPRGVHIDVRDISVMGMSWESSQQSAANRVGLDVKLGLELRVWNPNAYGLRYDRIQVDLGYRGSKLGTVLLQAGRIPPLSIVNVPATLDVESFVLTKAALLLVDIAMGDLPLETNVYISGNLELLFLRPRVETKLGCDIDVNPHNKEVLRQFCLVQA